VRRCSPPPNTYTQTLPSGGRRGGGGTMHDHTVAHILSQPYGTVILNDKGYG